MQPRRTLKKILDGSKNVRFSDALALAQAMGFQLVRVNGSHHILSHPNSAASLNLQNANGQAKPYQIQQLLHLVELHNLALEGTRSQEGTEGTKDEEQEDA